MNEINFPLLDWFNNQSIEDKPEIIGVLRREIVSKPIIYIGAGTCGLGAGAAETERMTRLWLADKNIDADIINVGCIGLCAFEPLLDIQLPGYNRISFSNVIGEHAADILQNVFELQIPEEKVLFQFRNGCTEWNNVQFMDEHFYFKPQLRIVLKNCGLINPESIDEYIARGGYRAIKSVLLNKSADQVCDDIISSGLRGRGGGGFPTGVKWKFARKTESDQKYLICNADEGDPGAFMDRAVIEGDPHRLLEGMAVAAFAIGASKSIVYIRAEYPLAIHRLKIAIEEAKSYGFLGKNILGSDFSLEIKIKKGAGAFVCGEETAMIGSIEGRRGMPRPRPPFPAVSGLHYKPTIINNVETLSNIPEIILKGHDWFSSIGTEKSKGTKVFALSGKIKFTGLVEVPMGMTIRKVIFDIAGGIMNNKKFKAVQIGGPSGGCITNENLDTPIDYESIIAKGAMMGSGGLVVMDENTCMVDVAKFFMDFIQRESCGKCIPCREGTKRMLDILESITNRPVNESQFEALERIKGVTQLEKLAKVISETSLCGLGQTAPNPVLSTIKWFRDEYEEHIFDRTCRAGVCTNLRHFSIVIDACTGCTICAKKCPTNAIIGSKKEPHFIIDDKCIACGTCLEVCKFNAILVS
jgi:NADH:ubiquinone oxidoreductase subunit F (NADH-binding)/Pyruvate/2-oxoacid:ferredoxin oxidoreductase delta subunit/(2Fe-2S) ferredoxin